MKMVKSQINPLGGGCADATRYEVIRECLDMLEGVKRSFSRDGAFQVPKKGYELAFEHINLKIEVLQGMLLEARYGTTQERMKNT